MNTRVLRSIIAFALILSLIIPIFNVSAAPPGQEDKLGKRDREKLAEEIAKGSPTVTVMIAAEPGSSGRVAAEIESLGGEVKVREDELGYLRAEIPTHNVEAASKMLGIVAVDLDEVVPLPDPRPEPEGALGVIAQPPPDASTPKANPYMPIQDIRAAEWLTNNPDWDGRGVTIGIVDTGVDLDHPSLQTTSTGERKIIDWVTGTHPTDDDDPTWVQMGTSVRGPSFTVNGVNYTAPARKNYLFGIFNERDARLGGELGRDVNRDGNPAGSSGLFAILWDPSANVVYVDTNQNNDFTDEMEMKDYKERFDYNHFGVDNPATEVVERLPFVVQTIKGKTPADHFVNIGIVSGAHGSHVAGIAAGNSLFGGEMSGVAPGAKIVSLRACLFITGCTGHALLEGMIYVVTKARVDVVNMSIGGLPALNDGNTVRSQVYNRLIEQYKVQMFFSAGNNGMGLNTAGDPAVTTDVMSVGAYITDDTYLTTYGAQLYEEDNLHYFSSRGPREDGGFKPNVVASGAAISTIPLWQPSGCLAHPCPVGYALFNGTSMASPQAAGAGALLISAAKQTGVQYRPDQIRQAMNSSARFLSGRYQAYEQGNGLLDVVSAWELLKTNIRTVKISSSVPVNTILSAFLANPGFGVGIHDREGVTAGQSYTRTYTFVRNDGPGKAITYNLSWVDNDGTFSSADSITLRKGEPVTLDVQINPATSGVHSAILNLDDPSTAGIDYQTMNVVIAADTFEAPGYSVTKSGEVGPGQFQTFFFYIPPGTPAFKVDMIGGGNDVGAGAIRFLRWHPWGLAIDSNAVSNCYNGAPGGCTTGSPTSRTVTNPQAGVWEVTVDARRNSDAVSAPFTITASILGATISPDPDIIPSASAGVPFNRQYTITNIFGEFTGRAEGTTLGSALLSTPTIAHLAQQAFFVNVAPSSTSVRFTIGSPSDPAADLDLFVFNCTSGTCVQVAQSADGDSEESVTINNPAAGVWAALVDAFSVPAGTTTYEYVDVFTSPAFGSISITDANAVRPAGASWMVDATITANAAPGSGRVLLGNVRVFTDANVLVGLGDVIIESVTP